MSLLIIPLLSSQRRFLAIRPSQASRTAPERHKFSRARRRWNGCITRYGMPLLQNGQQANPTEFPPPGEKKKKRKLFGWRTGRGGRRCGGRAGGSGLGGRGTGGRGTGGACDVNDIFPGNLYSDSRGNDETGRVTKFSRTLAPYVFPVDCSAKNPHPTPYS